MTSESRAGVATELAKTAALAVAPELVIPAEAVSRIVRARTHREPQDASGVITAPPEPFFVFKKARLRVMRRGDAKVIVYEPASGLTAKEVAELTALGALLVGAYYAGQYVKQQVSTVTKPTNPFSATLSFLSGGKL